MESIKKALTKRQEAILDYIKKEIKAHGIPPTVRDIGNAVGLSSTSSVFSQLNTLEKKGYIKRDPMRSRYIELNDDEFNASRQDMISIPIVGTVTAGQPILATENIEDYFPIGINFLPSEDSFFLKVKGESMINAHIMDGDLILVKRQSNAKNGDIVVALVGDEATVKTFYKEDGRYRLQPENDFMEPFYFDHVEILGLVTGVFRFM